ncbi:MAG: hypothetical protein ACLP6E_01705 [Acidimicrobiales bacterium]
MVLAVAIAVAPLIGAMVHQHRGHEFRTLVPVAVSDEVRSELPEAA